MGLFTRGKPEAESRPADIPGTCSFCGKPANAVQKLIAGPQVYICDDCVKTCVEILAQDGRDSGQRTCILCSAPMAGDGAFVKGRGLVCMACGHAVHAAMAPILAQSANMRRLIIRGHEEADGRVLDFDLREILDALGARAVASRWRISGLSYTSTDEQDIEVFGRTSGALIAGGDLLAGTERLLQVIDGHFEAFEDDKAPWVIVRAVDSSWWEVWSEEQTVLDAVRARFRRVEEREPA